MLPLLLLFAADPTTPAATPTVTPVAEKKVCWHDQVTGSIMPAKRICMTVAERRAWVAKMQGNVNAFANRPQRACSGQPGCDQ